MSHHATPEEAAAAVAVDILTAYADVHADVDPTDVVAKLRAHGWTWRGLCGVTTNGLTYTGVEGDLTCFKPAGHKGTHVSAEGAMW